MRLVTVVGAAALIACSSDPKPATDSRAGDGRILVGDGAVQGDGPRVDGPRPDHGTIDDASVGGCNCGKGEGCVTVRVNRTVSDVNLPWKVWPAEADGKGTLIASVAQPVAGGANVVARKTVVGANFSAPTASYVVDLGCVPAKSSDVRAFLDDNTNAGAQDYVSSDYRDTCMAAPRMVTVNVTAQQRQTAVLTLANSCD